MHVFADIARGGYTTESYLRDLAIYHPNYVIHSRHLSAAQSGRGD